MRQHFFKDAVNTYFQMLQILVLLVLLLYESLQHKFVYNIVSINDSHSKC